MSSNCASLASGSGGGVPLLQSSSPQVQLLSYFIVFLICQVFKSLFRMSAVHITFLWPVIITEMVLVFSAMEHELAMEQPEFRFSSKMSNLAT